jgi:hypothetical protein
MYGKSDYLLINTVGKKEGLELKIKFLEVEQKKSINTF